MRTEDLNPLLCFLLKFWGRFIKFVGMLVKAHQPCARHLSKVFCISPFWSAEDPISPLVHDAFPHLWRARFPGWL